MSPSSSPPSTALPNQPSSPAPPSARCHHLDPDSLQHLFHLLCSTPHTGGSRAPSAHALASTCSAFNVYFRTRYVTALSFNHAAPPSWIARCLSRFPLVTSISVAKHAGEGGHKFSATPRLDLSRALPQDADACPRVAHLALENLGLFVSEPWRSTCVDRPLRGVADAFPNLTSLSLHMSDPLSATDLYLSVFEPLCRTLERLDVSGDPDYRRIRSGLSDNFGARLQFATRLTHLNISGCGELGERSFRYLARMPALRSIVMRGTSAENEDVIAVLQGLPNLVELDVSCCQSLDSQILPYVPASLDTLKLAYTGLLCDDRKPVLPCLGEETGGQYLDPEDGQRMLPSSLANLRVLDARLQEIPLVSWRVLSGMHALQELRLDGRSMDDEPVPDEFAAEALLEMRSLRVLRIDESDCGDETAFAIARLPELRVLSMSDTCITGEGVATIAEGVCRFSLADVDFRENHLDLEDTSPCGTMALFEAALQPDAHVMW